MILRRRKEFNLISMYQVLAEHKRRLTYISSDSAASHRENCTKPFLVFAAREAFEDCYGWKRLGNTLYETVLLRRLLLRFVTKNMFSWKSQQRVKTTYEWSTKIESFCRRFIKILSKEDWKCLATVENFLINLWWSSLQSEKKYFESFVKNFNFTSK